MPINYFKFNIWMTYCFCQCACAVNKQSTLWCSIHFCSTYCFYDKQTFANILEYTPHVTCSQTHIMNTFIRIHFSAETLLPRHHWLDNQIVPPPKNDWQEHKQTDQCSENISVSLFRHQTTNDWLTVNIKLMQTKHFSFKFTF